MQLDLNDLLDFVHNQKYEYAYISKLDLKLYVTLNGLYIVEQNGEIVSKSMQPIYAIEKFNEIEQKGF